MGDTQGVGGTRKGVGSRIDASGDFGYDYHMPRRIRATAGGMVYHVLNRGVGRMRLFRKAADFAAMETGIGGGGPADEERGCWPIVLMSNHWHLLLWPREDGELSEVMRWLTVTHTQRWHANHHTSGTGPVYQGRFKSFPVESDDHLLTVARYIERNPLRAKMVEHAADWQWCSLWRRYQGGQGDPQRLASPYSEAVVGNRRGASD